MQQDTLWQEVERAMDEERPRHRRQTRMSTLLADPQ